MELRICTLSLDRRVPYNLISSYATGIIVSDQDFSSGTAFDRFSMQVRVNDKQTTVGLWNLNPSESYIDSRRLANTFADVIILCFAMDSYESLDAITKRWLPELAAFECSAHVLLAGCECEDPFDHLEGIVEKANEVANEQKLDCHIVNAHTQEALKDLFDISIGLASFRHPDSKSHANQKEWWNRSKGVAVDMIESKADMFLVICHMHAVTTLPSDLIKLILKLVGADLVITRTQDGQPIVPAF